MGLSYLREGGLALIITHGPSRSFSIIEPEVLQSRGSAKEPGSTAALAG